MASHCKFWLPKKNRSCANTPLLDSPFCGNHTQRSDSQWIPCPIDPSHSVLDENLESHLNRCPLLKQAQSLSRQPFYQKGINAGREEDDDDYNADSEVAIVTSEMKRNAVYAMPVPRFSELIAKIKSVHASVCNSFPDSYKVPEACSIWTNREVDKKLPYKEKHVLQQASILGNLEEFRVLRKSCSSSNGESECRDSNEKSERGSDVYAVVEFGAGRGYLTQMLADCYGIRKVLLVERKSYKLKADRSLRQKESLILERLRIDSKYHYKEWAIWQSANISVGLQQSDEHTTSQSRASCYLKGLAIATYKKYILELGFSKEDFHAISWFTSWAVDADHGSEFSVADCSSQLEIMSENKELCSESEIWGVGDIVRNMEAIDRAVLGYMCKDIIDAGRLMWVKAAQGLESELVKYVPVSISPENRLLLARTTSRCT
ncbi:tRNA:m(4)x modification enzyme trm13 [Phtheirospermum japonicum]|uniref:tRNA:m(4)X modification enzyme TRM13 n=1 Tax=Phtheirospermum japonicum TaxID=374723 RepID=A0A830C1T9_9LAMI|nr:tRNA:m(4)x modification enzyme trm13 [Phtheirospermum japonicum]